MQSNWLIWAGAILAATVALGLVKVGKKKMGLFIGAGIVLVVVGLISSGVIDISNLSLGAVTGDTTIGTDVATADYMSLCPTLATTNVYGRAEDTGASVLTWLTATDSLALMGDNFFDITADPSATSPGYSGAIAVPCGMSKLTSYIVTNTLSVGAKPQTFSNIDQKPLYVSFKSAAQATGYKARVKDMKNDNYLSVGSDTGYQNLDKTFNETGAYATIDTGSDGYQNIMIYLASNETNKRSGLAGNDAECGVFVDLNTASWAQPVYVKVDGISVANAKTSLSSNDQVSTSAYEYFYPFPKGIAITDSPLAVEVYIKAKASTDPADADDPIFLFACKGYYQSSVATDQILYGYYKDDASQTKVAVTADAITLDEIA